MNKISLYRIHFLSYKHTYIQSQQSILPVRESAIGAKWTPLRIGV